MTVYSYYDSPIGFLRLESNGSDLTGLYYTTEADHLSTDLSLFVSVRSWLDSYFRGDPAEPGFFIHLTGTPFQLQVWDILRSIPFGEVRTYGDIAREMAIRTGKQKMSAQAVGQAVGRNPISILIPCHRVVGGGGKLTGYAGGLEKKQWLLRHEGLIAAENRSEG